MIRAALVCAALALAGCGGQLVLRVRCEEPAVLEVHGRPVRLHAPGRVELALEAEVDPDQPEDIVLPSGSCSATVERKEQ